MRIPRWNLVCLALLALAGCGGGERESASGGEPVRVIRHENWDDFVAAKGGRGARRQVVVIGLDAAPWHYVDRLIAEGRMPNLARVLREGARATLRSVEPAVTPPAWTAMFSGYTPVHAGVYSFGYWNDETNTFRGANGNDVVVPFVWEAASRAGLEVAIANVPMTYPVREVSGIMVSGMMTPVDILPPLRVQTLRVPERLYRDAPGAPDYSPPVRGAAGDSLTGFLWRFHDTIDDGQRRYDTVALRVLAHDGAGTRELAFHVGAAGAYTPWIPVRARVDGQVADAWTRAFLDATPDGEFTFRLSRTVPPLTAHYTDPPALADELERRFGFYLPSKYLDAEVTPQITRDMAGAARFFYDYGDWDLYTFVITETDKIHHYAGFGPLADEVYAACDSLIGEIMARMPEDAVLVIASDHGSKKFTVGVDLNQAFEQMGLLQFDRPRRVDYAHTLVFHNISQIYFNRELITKEALTERGIDPGDDPVEALKDHVTRALADLRGPDGTPRPVTVTRPPADAAGQAPELLVRGTYDDYAVIFWNLDHGRDAPVVELDELEGMWHQRDGILAMWGGPVRRGEDIGTWDIADVAPTLLYLLGLPVAPDMDGKLITGAFEPAFLRDTPLHINNGYRDIPRAAVTRDDRKDEDLEKQLRSLGYIR